MRIATLAQPSLLGILGVTETITPLTDLWLDEVLRHFGYCWRNATDRGGRALTGGSLAREVEHVPAPWITAASAR